MKRTFQALINNKSAVLGFLAGGMLLVTLIMALTVYETFSRRARAHADVEHDLRLLSTAVRGYTEISFHSLELLLRNIDRDIAGQDLERPDHAAETTAMLKRRAADFPMLSTINILDADGRQLVTTSRWQKGKSFSDREYFHDARDLNDNRRILIGRPIVGRNTQRWTIPVVLSRQDAAGRFSGIVFIGLDIEKLTDYYRNSLTIDGGSTSLLRTDGSLLARLPEIPGAYGRNFSHADLFQHYHANRDGGFYHTRSGIDGMSRSVAYRSIPAFDLLVTVSADDERIEAAWRQDLWQPITVCAIGLLALFLMLQLSRKHSRNQQAFQDKIAWQANHDATTGLPNRYLFENRLRKAMSGTDRQSGVLALMFIDLDNFKRINDSMGHAVGDDVLRTTALWLQSCVRQSDTVARFGGDEFAILLPDVPPVDGITAVAAKILQRFNQPMRCGKGNLTVTVSIGVSTYPNDGATASALMASADAAMYRAKDSGRNLVCHFDQAMAEHIRDRMEIEDQLHEAMERRELTLTYQPIMNSAGTAPLAVEALLRWQSPVLGTVSPSQFIPIAEGNGQIVTIGRWILDQACGQAAAWAAESSPLRVAVNISPRQLSHPRFLDMVRDTLARHALSPDLLEMEITEGLLISPDSEISVKLGALRGMGIRLSVDDFGTGYSSLAYLARFPVNSLKIDRSFVQHVERDEQARSLARAIVALAHSLDLETIAEGVENEAQAAFLREIGCRALQGFHFSSALPPRELAGWLRAAAGKEGGKAG